MTNRKTTSTCPLPYGHRDYNSRNNETLNPLKFYKSSLGQTQRGVAARCQGEEHVDCRCQRSPVRAPCFLSVPGRPELVAKLLAASRSARPSCRFPEKRHGALGKSRRPSWVCALQLNYAPASHKPPVLRQASRPDLPPP